jgi:sugar phosphate isomerase/epimerase
MQTGSTVAERIGLSALCVASMPLMEAIDVARGAGFAVFEFVPHLYGGPEQVDPALRRVLRAELASFKRVTVHSSTVRLADGRRADISSPDNAHRQASVNHYLEIAQLALDIGADIATYHAAYQTEADAIADQRDAHLLFARMIDDRFAESGLQMGFEYFDDALARRIKRARFGVLFDVGHAAMRSQGDLTTGAVKMIEVLASSVIEYHIHGVRVDEDGGRSDHRSFEDNNGIDYARVVHAIKRHGFTGPLVLEIGAWQQNVARNVVHTTAARAALARLWACS